MKKLLPLAMLALLSGCSTLEMLDNRVSCTVDGGQAYVNSMYGPFGVTSKIAEKDGVVICKKGK